MHASARDLLDNIIWNSLTGPHLKFAAGAGDARRYAKGFSPIVGFRNPERPDLAALIPFCDPGEHFYCDIWSGPPPDDWQIDKEATMLKMVWEGATPANDEAPDAIPLRADHAAQAVTLATLTNPGPFGLRTIEIGEYFGYFEDSRLIAMAGERMSFNKPLHLLQLIAALLQETNPAARLWQDKSISSQLTQQASRYATGQRCIRATSHDRPAGFWPLN